MNFGSFLGIHPNPPLATLEQISGQSLLDFQVNHSVMSYKRSNAFRIDEGNSE